MIAKYYKKDSMSMHSYFFTVQLAHSYYPKQSISVCTISTNPLLVTLYFSKPGINSPNNWPKEPKEWGIVRLDLQFLDAFWLSKECHTETSLQLHTQHIHGASSMYSNIHYPGFKDFKDKLLILKVKMLKTSRKKKTDSKIQKSTKIIIYHLTTHDFG